MSTGEAKAHCSALPVSYNCGTWIADLLERDVVFPGNLVVIGTSDHPGYMARPGEIRGMPAYRQAYLSLEQRGVKVITKKSLREIGAGGAAAEALAGLSGKAVYVSLDADLGSGEATRAVRFLDTLRLSGSEMLELARELGARLKDIGSELAGLDVMEIDVHIADIPGSHDRTVDVCAGVVGEVLTAAGGL